MLKKVDNYYTSKDIKDATGIGFMVGCVVGGLVVFGMELAFLWFKGFF